MSIKSEVKGNSLVLTIELATVAYASNSEIAKAAKEGREPAKNMLASSGGFIRLASGQRVSLNVMA